MNRHLGICLKALETWGICCSRTDELSQNCIADYWPIGNAEILIFFQDSKQHSQLSQSTHPSLN